MYARGRDIGRENENVRERVIEGVRETEEDEEDYRKNVRDRQT